jgi:hypothetical protein
MALRLQVELYVIRVEGTDYAFLFCSHVLGLDMHLGPDMDGSFCSIYFLSLPLTRHR